MKQHQLHVMTTRKCLRPELSHVWQANTNSNRLIRKWDHFFLVVLHMQFSGNQKLACNVRGQLRYEGTKMKKKSNFSEIEQLRGVQLTSVPVLDYLQPFKRLSFIEMQEYLRYINHQRLISLLYFIHRQLKIAPDNDFLNFSMKKLVFHGF